MPVRYRVVHRTEYQYAAEVSASYSQLRMLPRDAPRQRCISAGVVVDPRPDHQREHVDYFGNRVEHVAIQHRHRRLHLTTSSVVEVDEAAGALPLLGDRSWEEVRDSVGVVPGPDAVAAVHFALDSALVRSGPDFAAYAQPSFTPGRSIVEAVCELTSRIHADFEFAPGETKTDTTPEEALKERHGVCQDFAHVGVACLRSLGLPARYVSGYMETDPPPGREKLVGADVSHAWFSVLMPGAGWLDVDPTNDQVVGGRYIVTAYGRDYQDIAPVSGVIYTRGYTKSLRVTVDVTALPAGAA
ncbi:hypothetical protein DSM112329_00217 [Paraconexibacter sp. AEG42_29]|uniref:Transglutaminase-like domain-containing protein n=1 Tax=Paraconexibacter sp. AEG42_29 TaxID=2997339 RepID=A0AAU7AP16_9ACTN